MNARPALAGDILDARCDCGYAKAGLFVFAGKANYRSMCKMPALCRPTGEIVLRDVLGDGPTSPACPEAAAVYGVPGLEPLGPTRDIAAWNVPGRNLTLRVTDGLYVCPRCGRRSLGFRQTGHWD